MPKSPSTHKKYYRVSEACDRLSLGKTKVYELIAAGLLKRCKLPSPGNKRNMTRITTASIESYERSGDIAEVIDSVKRQPREPSPAMRGRDVKHFR